MNCETSKVRSWSDKTEGSVKIRDSFRFKIERDTQNQLMAWIVSRWPRVRAIYTKTKNMHHSMPPWECMLLAGVGTWFNFEGARIMEIGGCKGGSAAIWAEAAPKATIHTLEPAQRYQKELARNLKPYPNVKIHQAFSWQHFEATADDNLQWDLVFVDGSHVFVHKDLVWWNRLKIGGLMLFDDFTPRIYPVVCAAVRDLWECMGHESIDIRINRRNRAGMAGVWKRSLAAVWPEMIKIEI